MSTMSFGYKKRAVSFSWLRIVIKYQDFDLSGRGGQLAD